MRLLAAIPSLAAIVGSVALVFMPLDDGTVGLGEPVPGPTAMMLAGEASDPPVVASALALTGSGSVAVTRPTSGRIVVEGGTYAIIEPFAPLVEGVPVHLASMGVAYEAGQVLAWSVNPGLAYEVTVAVVDFPADGSAPGDAVFSSHTLVADRVDMLVAAVRHEQESVRLAVASANARAAGVAIRDSLAPIAFAEWVQALSRMNLEDLNASD